MTAVWLDPTHGVNALMGARSLGLDDASYAKVLSHLRILAISAQDYAPELGEPQESPFPLGRYFSRDANLTSADVCHSICQRCTCHGSSSPRAKLPLSTRWQYTIIALLSLQL